uniref:Fe2OG dioxygenase domain-containing protein n=1 Tax=Chromera velia CCMP2878 TaxID=1169474 RepID=A0A0G4EZ82_9ALVE|mmetsp:Transcript_32964/g.65266  ORF Transcript_32964/g.65266 Transcript_32964/m.65266 type:complete len:399 (-) Transcript_32964:82-1278(-)|eukprot:Cvel_2534.t1-p1 / transcript=Cvel_2534.t1 / gene=Cvel_2534 / organism=Chromera_velia_CCMP2878 / gene_product=1-aminocyclopropane-1-carboxylate oxidase homolog 1, putative / transcript_product=1-aminocyclopropane-1-carboxylate oxidase homolog 1, putative / location=Cvel_scaffold100:48870-50063(-) / protein_length=398 / sequence_SO=supercontig / SO=protein_coding / is_pseudo=false
MTSADQALAREAQLKREAEEWAPPTVAETIPIADATDIPVLDLAPFLEASAGGRESDAETAAALLAEKLRHVGEKVGFHYVINHGVSSNLLRDAVSAIAKFHALEKDAKMKVAMDTREDLPTGVGYLPVGNFKLPARTKPNVNGAYIIKREHGPRNVTLDRMPWPPSHPESSFDGPSFKAALLKCCDAFEKLALAMLPLYAKALAVPPSDLLEAFRSPLFRLRATHYPPTPVGDFGVNPHVDTSFFTLLYTTDPSGLVVFSKAKNCWVRCREVPRALIVNSGETLQRLTNDRWQATRHYVLNPLKKGVGEMSKRGENGVSDCVTVSVSQSNGLTEEKKETESDPLKFDSLGSRYSLPFFFNPTADYTLSVLPSCTSEDNPPKYPPQSYLEGQGVVQGE